MAKTERLPRGFPVDRPAIHGPGLRTRRTALGMSGEQLAKKLTQLSGVRVQTWNVSDWERERRRPPKTMWRHLAKALKVRRQRDLASAPKVS